MVGLARDALDSLVPELTLGRIRQDIRSDFILAPQYSAVFTHAAEELWEYVLNQLGSGSFQPSLPLTVEVPKPSKLTRPGAILTPADRVVYQGLTDIIAPKAEAQLDRERVFSYVLLADDPDSKMFQEAHTGWSRMKDALTALASAGSWEFAIRADVAGFFERLYQHNLINLLKASGCDGSAVNSLESVLLAWMQRDSHGIIQGVFPSDFLGNFYLCGLDADLQLRGIPSVRYVDDIYLFMKDERDALDALLHLGAYLRREGLLLNESKTAIHRAVKLVQEETELDQRFAQARTEVVSNALDMLSPWYGFQSTWELEEAEQEVRVHIDVDLLATKALYEHRSAASAAQMEKIDRFCLPLFAAAQSDIALEDTLQGILRRPHMSQVYASYLASLLRTDSGLASRFAQAAPFHELPYDWQAMCCVGALLSAQAAPASSVDESIRVLRNARKAAALRGVCAIFAGKFGNAAQRRILRLHYSEEPSEYVRSAILFASRYFPANERNTCIAAWGGHSVTNSLIAKAVKVLVQDS